jgi:hypothetical protein
MMVLGVGLEVLGQLGDALREKSDLDLRGSGVAFMAPVTGDRFRFLRGELGQFRFFLKDL